MGGTVGGTTAAAPRARTQSGLSTPPSGRRSPTRSALRRLQLLATCALSTGAAPAAGAAVAARGHSCEGDSQGLLWRSRHGDTTVYLLGTYNAPAAQLELIEAPVAAVVGCADVAYFPLACAESDYGTYRSHCGMYPQEHSQAVLADRLGKKDLAALVASAKHLASAAPSDCVKAAEKFEAAVADVQDARKGTTLRALQEQASIALDPLNCAAGSDSQNYEAWVREQLLASPRPLYGLEDVEDGCKWLRGASVEEDEKLAKRLTVQWADKEWAANVTRLHRAMAKVASCGDLKTFASSLKGVADVPWLDEGLLTEQNKRLASAVEHAAEENSGKAILVVVGVEHLTTVGQAKGLLDLLPAAGLELDRLEKGFQCHTKAGSKEESSAKHSAAEPAEKGEVSQCLMPRGSTQPESCEKFQAALAKKLGKDTAYNRSKASPDCGPCLGGNKSCSCVVEWKNDAEYKELCRGLTVDGVHGEVYLLDLTRNPGSTQPGASVAEKNVIGLYQKCYATSCDLKLFEEHELRIWYSTDPSLTGGRVVIRPADPEPGFLARATGGLSGAVAPLQRGTSGSLKWVMAGSAAALLLLAAGAAVCHIVRSRRHTDPQKKVRSWHLSPAPSPREPFQKGSARSQQTQDDEESASEEEEAQTGCCRGAPAPDSQARPPSARAPPAPARGPPPDGVREGEPFDRSLILQAMHMRQKLGEAGAFARQQLTMSGLQGMHESAMQSMHVNVIPAQAPQVVAHPGGWLTAAPSFFVGGGSPAGSQLYMPLALEEQAQVPTVTALYPLQTMQSFSWGYR